LSLAWNHSMMKKAFAKYSEADLDRLLAGHPAPI
jgi:hypothetical protein